MSERPLRVLLVEDDPDDAFLLQDMLTEAASTPVELDHVRRLAQALERAQEANYDAVLCDLSLPDSQGLDTFLQVRQALPDTPVVVLTGLDDETIAVSAVQQGAQDYLVKGQVNGSLLVRSVRYAIERQRNSHYQAVLTERERFDAAVSQMSDGIIVTDGDWRITHANRAACLLVNLPAEGWQGLPLQQVLAPFSLSAPPEEVFSASDKVSSVEIARTDTRPQLYLDARLSRLLDARGHLVSTVLTLRDITDSRLSRHVQANFFTTVSHKLRTPLAVLCGYLELSKHLSPDRMVREWGHVLQVCEAELQHLAGIVEEMLDFKALSSWQPETRLDATNVPQAVAQAVDTVLRHYPTRQVEVTTDVSLDAEWSDCTQDHLTFVLEKLLDNAAKFGDKDPVRINVTVRRDDGWLRFSISDNGPGIPHEYYDRIFEGFIQIEDRMTGQVPGLGIGLRMARQVVEAYGGAITVQSRMGEGSTFSFTLPASTSPDPVPTTS